MKKNAYISKFVSRYAVAVITVFCIICSLLFGDNIEKKTAVFTVTKPDFSPLVIIDPGHGGFDGGAVADDGTVEKDINLSISLTLSDLLKTAGYDVIMTRDEDISTDDTNSDKISSRKKSDMQNRLKLTKENENAVFVSIHLNKFTTSAAKGAQVFYGGRNILSEALGECIRKDIVSLLQPDNKRVNKLAGKSTYLLYNSDIPSVLVECGFLSNHSELQLLKDTEYQKKLAFCCYCGITDYFFQKGDS